MLKTLGSLVLLVATIATAAMPAAAEVIAEVRPFVGGYVPTGDQRDDLKDAVLAGAQVGVEVMDRLHVVGTFAWSPTKLVVSNQRRIDVYQMDAGLEAFRIMPMNTDWEFRPFIGAGAGARMYDPHGRNLDTKTRFAGYGGLGAEFQLGRLALRIEGRDYLSRGDVGPSNTDTRNDVLLMGAGVFHW